MEKVSRRSYFSKRNIKVRREFAKMHLELCGKLHQLYVHKRKGQNFKGKNAIPTVKHGGGLVMLWDYFGASEHNEIRLLRCYGA